MKSYEDRLRLKNHFFKLGQGRIIEVQHTAFWQVLWQEPEDSNDIYELLTPLDIKNTRDHNKINFLTLIRILSEKIVDIFESNRTLQDANVLLNCIRFLTKLLPFLYEIPEYIEEIEDELFWTDSFDPMKVLGHQEARPLQSINIRNSNSNNGNDPQHAKESPRRILGHTTLKALLGLLFVRGFTLDSSKSASSSIWEPGIGLVSSKYVTPNPIIDSNRSEILKLILTLVSNPLYELPSKIVAQGSKFLTLLVVAMPRVELLTLVCSLFNVLCRSAKSGEENGLIYSSPDLAESRHLMVTYAAQLLTLMIAYPLPASEHLTFLSDLEVLSTNRPVNMARLYVGKLHKDSELLFLYSHLMGILKQPLVRDDDTSKFSLVKSSSSPSIWSCECIMLLWELLQCNKTFKAVVAARFSDELLIVLTFHLSTFSASPPHRNLVRLCSYFMLYLSSDPKLMELIFGPIKEPFYQSFPLTFKTNPRPITTRDFVVIHISAMISNAVAISGSNPDYSTMTLVEILYHLIPPVSSRDLQATNDDTKKMGNANAKGGLGYSACWSVTQLIIKLSSRKFLEENPLAPDFLALVIRSICTSIIKYPKSSRMLMFSVLKNEKVYEDVWNTILSFEATPESDSEEETTAESTPDNERDEFSLHEDDSASINSTKDKSEVSESALLDYKNIEESLRSIPPTGMSERAREKLPMNSPLKRTWGGKDSLRIILNIIIPQLKELLQDQWSSGPKVESWVIVKQIEAFDFDSLVAAHRKDINYDFLPSTPLVFLQFNWSHLSLGWYLSLLYGDTYNSISNVKEHCGGNNKIMKNITSSLATVSKLTSSWTSFIKNGSSTNHLSQANEARILERVRNSLTNTNQWFNTSIRLFKIQSSGDGIFGAAYGRLGSISSQQGPPVNLVRRFSDFKVSNHRNSVGSGLSTPVEEQDATFGRPHRSSISSLHSLNTFNRSNTNTPRNSISMP